jgi:hypothetical protein
MLVLRKIKKKHEYTLKALWSILGVESCDKFNYHLVLKAKVEVPLWDIEVRYFQSHILVQHKKKQQNCCFT